MLKLCLTLPVFLLFLTYGEAILKRPNKPLEEVKELKEEKIKFEECVEEFQTNATKCIEEINQLSSKICEEGIKAGRESAEDATSCVKNATQNAREGESGENFNFNENFSNFFDILKDYGPKVVDCGFDFDCQIKNIEIAGKKGEENVQLLVEKVKLLWKAKQKMIDEIKDCIAQAREGLQEARALCDLEPLDDAEIPDSGEFITDERTQLKRSVRRADYYTTNSYNYNEMRYSTDSYDFLTERYPKRSNNFASERYPHDPYYVGTARYSTDSYNYGTERYPRKSYDSASTRYPTESYYYGTGYSTGSYDSSTNNFASERYPRDPYYVGTARHSTDSYNYGTERYPRKSYDSASSRYPTESYYYDARYSTGSYDSSASNESQNYSTGSYNESASFSKNESYPTTGNYSSLQFPTSPYPYLNATPPTNFSATTQPTVSHNFSGPSSFPANNRTEANGFNSTDLPKNSTLNEEDDLKFSPSGPLPPRRGGPKGRPRFRHRFGPHRSFKPTNDSSESLEDFPPSPPPHSQRWNRPWRRHHGLRNHTNYVNFNNSDSNEVRNHHRRPYVHNWRRPYRSGKRRQENPETDSNEMSFESADT